MRPHRTGFLGNGFLGNGFLGMAFWGIWPRSSDIRSHGGKEIACLVRVHGERRFNKFFGHDLDEEKGLDRLPVGQVPSFDNFHEWHPPPVFAATVVRWS